MKEATKKESVSAAEEMDSLDLVDIVDKTPVDTTVTNNRKINERLLPVESSLVPSKGTEYAENKDYAAEDTQS